MEGVLPTTNVSDNLIKPASNAKRYTRDLFLFGKNINSCLTKD